MPQLVPADWAPQLVWLAITFGVLYFIMAKFALPKIGSVIEQRRDRIANDLQQAAQLKEQTEQAIANYETALAEAKAKAHSIAQETKDKLNSEIEEQTKVVEERLSEKTRQAEDRIRAMKDEALTQVQEVATDTAETIVSELANAKVTKAKLKSAVTSAMKS